MITIFTKAFSHFACLWVRDVRGAIAVMFALMLPVLILFIAAGTDMTMALLERQKLQNALDAAALAAASSGELDTALIRKKATAFLKANKGYENITESDVHVTIESDAVTISLNGVAQLYFLESLLGVQTIDITARTSLGTDSSVRDLEVVLAMDVSQNMKDEMIAVRTGAINIITTLEDFSIKNPGITVKVGLVPWSQAVVLDPFGLGQDLDGDPYSEGFLVPHQFVDFDFNDGSLSHYDAPLGYMDAYHAAKGHYSNSCEWTRKCVVPDGAYETRPIYLGDTFRHSADDLILQLWSDEKKMRECFCGNTFPPALCDPTILQPWYRNNKDMPGMCVPGRSTCECTRSCAKSPTRHIISQSEIEYYSENDPSKWSALPDDPDDLQTPEGTKRSGDFVRASAEIHLPYDYNTTPLSTLYNDGTTSLATFGNPLIPLTDAYDVLREQIEAWVSAGSSQNGAAGLLWAYRVLSPAFPFEEGQDFDDTTTRKVVVFVMDGLMKDTDKQDLSKNALREKKMCDALKEKGVIIYSVLKRMQEERTVWYCTKTITPILDPGQDPIPPYTETKECALFSPDWFEADEKKTEIINIPVAYAVDLHNYCAGAKGIEDNSAYKFAFTNQEGLESALTDVGTEISKLRIVK